MNRLLLRGHIQQAETVKSRSPTLQLQIEVLGIFHIFITSIDSQSKHTHLVYNEFHCLLDKYNYLRDASGYFIVYL